MRKISLFIFAILILGCENQNPLIEENKALIADNKALIAASSQLVESAQSLYITESEHVPNIVVPSIEAAYVLDGDADLDPKPMNRDGIWIKFNKRIAVSQINLHLKGGPTLNWSVQWGANQRLVTLAPPNPCAILMNDRTYVIDVLVQDYFCHGTEFSITFSTKP